MPKPSTPNSRKTSSSEQEPSSQEAFYEAIEIIAKKGNKYLVAWAGVDPGTGNQWEPSWEPKENCSKALLATWTEKQQGKGQQKKQKGEQQNQSPAVAGKKRPTPISISSTPVPGAQTTPQSGSRRRASSRRSTPTPQAVTPKPETQSSEYLPSQVLPPPDTSSSPTLRRQTSQKKRKASFGVVIPAKSNSGSHSASNAGDLKDDTPRPVTPQAAKVPSSPGETPEEARVIKKRRLSRKVIEDSQPDPPSIKDLPPAADSIEVSPIRSPSPVKNTPIEPTKETIIVSDPVAPESPAQSSRRQSRSRQPTPQLLAPARNRSLSPVTKVDSWFSIASDNDYGDAIAEHEETVPTSDPLGIPSTSSMNPSGPPMGSVGPAFTPIQTLHRQMSQAQSNISQAGTPSPTIPPPTGRPAGQPVRRASGGHSRRSGSGSHQSFSSSLALRERLQSVSNSAVYKEIRSLASYAKKTPSLTSSGTGSSILSGGTSVSSLSTANLSNLKLVNLGEGEKILAVSGSGLQSRMTRGVLINKQAQIQQFCLNPIDASDDLVATMKKLMSTCSAVATHPYLIIAPPLANADLDEAKEAEYLMSSSGKFAALGKILDALRSDKETKVGIMVQDVKGMDMLEGFLRGRNIRVRRTDGESVREQQNVQSRGGPDITIVLGGKAGARAIVNRVDVVIAMDLSFNPEDDQALRLRQHPTNLDELSPVIRLVTVNSAEHVRLCLPAPYEIPSDRIVLQGLVSATTILRNFNGMEIPNDAERFAQVAEFLRSGKEVDVFGIRDIEGYMAGHRGLAGLALKRARSPLDDQSGDRKRIKTTKPTWQQPSMAMLQRENDELHETLGRKQQVNESLRTDLETLQKSFDTLSIQKTEIQARLQHSLDENQSIRDQLVQAEHTDPMFLQGEIIRLTKALESKTRDFDFLAARYQDASVAANESSNAVKELKDQVEVLTIRLARDVKAVTWEGERKVLMDKVKELEGKCKLLEEREERIQRKEGSGASA